MGIDPTTGLPVGMGRPPGLVPFSFPFLVWVVVVAQVKNLDLYFEWSAQAEIEVIELLPGLLFTILIRQQACQSRRVLSLQVWPQGVVSLIDVLVPRRHVLQDWEV